MKPGRRLMVVVFGLVGLVLGATGAPADTSALAPRPEDPDSHVRLATDRLVGFAPMTVNLSGMVQTSTGDLRPVGDDEQVRVVIDLPFLRAQHGVPVRSVYSEMHYETTTGPEQTAAPFRRTVELLRPGTYTFRVHVLSNDGQVLSSNEVSVKAL